MTDKEKNLSTLAIVCLMVGLMLGGLLAARAADNQRKYAQGNCMNGDENICSESEQN